MECVTLTTVMSKVWITGDFPRPDEVAAYLHLSASRASELRRRLFDLQVTKPNGTGAGKPFRNRLKAGAAKATAARRGAARAKKM